MRGVCAQWRYLAPVVEMKGGVRAPRSHAGKEALSSSTEKGFSEQQEHALSPRVTNTINMNILYFWYEINGQRGVEYFGRIQVRNF